jgi:putative transposase
MVRDLMVASVERRFGIGKRPYAIEWLSDNGSVCIAKDKLDIATTLGLKYASLGSVRRNRTILRKPW